MKLIKREDIRAGFKMSLLIIFPYIMVGFISGVFLESAGLNFVEIGLMSLMVNAGSAQFVAASMIGNLDSILSIILTTFVINFRHLLYTSGLSLKIKTTKIRDLIFIGQTTTDEIFAFNAELYNEGDWNDYKAMVFGFFGLIYWIVGNILGGVFGDLVSVPNEIASFTLISIFLLLIVLQTDTRKKLLVALVSIPLALGIMYFYRGSFNIIIASTLGAFIGYWLDRKEEESNGI